MNSDDDVRQETTTTYGMSEQEYTTIRIRVDQKWVLDDLKASDGEPYEGVVSRLIDSYSEDLKLTEDRVREVAREELREAVVSEALR